MVTSRKQVPEVRKYSLQGLKHRQSDCVSPPYDRLYGYYFGFTSAAVSKAHLLGRILGQRGEAIVSRNLPAFQLLFSATYFWSGQAARLKAGRTWGPAEDIMRAQAW